MVTIDNEELKRQSAKEWEEAAKIIKRLAAAKEEEDIKQWEQITKRHQEEYFQRLKIYQETGLTGSAFRDNQIKSKLASKG